jgi:dTDP-4-amino-4,6-dideoxygalactose transaminase
LVPMIRMRDFEEEFKSMEEEIRQAVERVLNSGWFVLGDEVKEIEKEFSRYIGTKYAAGVNSGTDALLISLMALGIKSGDEVITVSHTTTPTALSIILSGASPVFVDISPDTYTMDISQVERKITKKTKAIIPVHLYGNPADMDPIMEIAQRHKIHVVEDACQAHGAEYKGKKAGAFGILSAFSFYPTKNLGGCGDGGMILTNDADLYEKAVMLRQYGWKNRYTAEIMGINSRLDEIQAAILRVKLKYLDEWNIRRIRTVGLYKELLKDEDIILPKEQNHGTHIYHQFVIRHRERDRLHKYLREKGIETQIHYPIPVHRQKAFLDLGIKVKLPTTEKICKEVLSLPIHPLLKEEDIHYISRCVSTCR